MRKKDWNLSGILQLIYFSILISIIIKTQSKRYNYSSTGFGFCLLFSCVLCFNFSMIRFLLNIEKTIGLEHVQSLPAKNWSKFLKHFYQKLNFVKQRLMPEVYRLHPIEDLDDNLGTKELIPFKFSAITWSVNAAEKSKFPSISLINVN